MSKFNGKVVLSPTASANITAREFLSLNEKEKENIKEIHFSPPTLGTPGFGSFFIKYKMPILVRK